MLRAGKFKGPEIYEYIKKNNDSLSNVTGYKITEYAAPAGVHPQPLMTKELEKLEKVLLLYRGQRFGAQQDFHKR